MSNELVFFLITFLSLIFVTISGYGGKTWLQVVVVILALISSVTAGKVILVFGFATSIATPIYAGIFLATDALSEIYGRKEAQKTVWFAVLANVMLIGLGQLIVNTPALINKELSDALLVIFSFIPRLVLGGVVAFIVAQTLDIYLFEAIKKRTGEKKLWLRNNLSTIISQFVDSSLIYVIAFWGIVPNVFELIITAWIMKLIVAILDTPFIYIVKQLRTRN